MGKTTTTSTTNETDVKAPAAPTLDAQTRRQVEKTIARVNGLVTDAGGRYDDVADHLFETYYDGDVQRALTPAKDTPAGIAALAREADGALMLGRTLLFHAVRIGALNRRLTRTAWTGLGWSMKAELLPLLGSELSYERLSAGAVHASKTKATIREVRDYVALQLVDGSEEGEEKTAAKGPGLPAGRRALAVTAALGKAADRRRWVSGFLKMSADDRGAFLTDVKASARNLEKLAQELASAVYDG
ncbi:MAG: hypothetical protein RL199_312 [Pseudomonadota bacterium]|jgi:hypothetical protein